MDQNLQISVDKLPIRRLESIEESGIERYPSDVGYDEKRVSLIRRIDFAWAVEAQEDDEDRERTKKKQKKKISKDASSASQWQGMVENLHLAHQELSVIIDLINTVETNDAVTVASMTRPKQLPGETLADLSVSVATKLQCYRHLGKYFKQAAKALDQQIAKEARFYGALIRLQQNWKVKRQRGSVLANEGFTFDLFNSSLYDSTLSYRPSPLSTIHIDHDPDGMLAINLPSSSCRSLCFGFLGPHFTENTKQPRKLRPLSTVDDPIGTSEKDLKNDDQHVRETHSRLREAHQAIFDEQVFDMLNREAFQQSSGVNVTGIRENYLQLSIGQGSSLFISLVPYAANSHTVENVCVQNAESAVVPVDSSVDNKSEESKHDNLGKKWAYPNRTCYEIYLQLIIHEHAFVRAKEKPHSAAPKVSGPVGKEKTSLLSHFCMSLANRIFSNRVLMELEFVVGRVPYIHMMTHPTWYSRTSSWTLFIETPQSIPHLGSQYRMSDTHHSIKPQFRTTIVVNDDRINVEGDGAPNIVGSFRTKSANAYSVNKYECDLADLPLIVLQQVASQVILWLHEEALMVGLKANRDFLRLTIEVEQGETLSLVAHVDPCVNEACLSWWLVIDSGFTEEKKLHMEIENRPSDYRKFLGHLSLDVLYSTLMDLVSLCDEGGRRSWTSLAFP